MFWSTRPPPVGVGCSTSTCRRRNGSASSSMPEGIGRWAVSRGRRPSGAPDHRRWGWGAPRRLVGGETGPLPCQCPRAVERTRGGPDLSAEFRGSVVPGRLIDEGTREDPVSCEREVSVRRGPAAKRRSHGTGRRRRLIPRLLSGRDERGRGERGRDERGRDERGRGERGRGERGRDERGRGRDERGQLAETVSPSTSRTARPRLLDVMPTSRELRMVLGSGRVCPVASMRSAPSCQRRTRPVASG